MTRTDGWGPGKPRLLFDRECTADAPAIDEVKIGVANYLGEVFFELSQATEIVRLSWDGALTLAAYLIDNALAARGMKVNITRRPIIVHFTQPGEITEVEL
jgi:hypothetical protein